VARAPTEEPDGLVYQPELLTADEEATLLDELGSLRFDPIVLHGRAAKRTGRHFGLDYDYGTRTPKPGEPIPDWLLPVRERAAELAGRDPEELVEILVQLYPEGSTIGWHRDAPAFGTIVGVSLGGSSRLRFQRGKRDQRRVWELQLEPRSGYVLAGEARRSWEHSIPPTRELRYSITFRTLREGRAP
jgi:alkylated DNA repair protein (DNA oxidative demethylase)